MYIDWADNFGWYSKANMRLVYDYVINHADNGIVLNPGGGREGRGDIKICWSKYYVWNYYPFFTKDISIGTKKIVQFGVKKIPDQNILFRILFFGDGATQARIDFQDTDIIIRNSDLTNLQAFSHIFSEDYYDFIEIRLTHGASGNITIRINSVELPPVIGNFTSGVSGVNAISVYSAAVLDGVYMCDYVIADVSTGDDSFIDDHAVYYSPPAKDILTQFINVTFIDGGSTQDDIILKGASTVSVDVSFVVEIDSSGVTDTFKWSDDGGSTWIEENVSLTTDPIILSNGQQIAFVAVTGHSIGDRWSWTLPHNQYASVNEKTLDDSTYIQTFDVDQVQLFENYEEFDSLYEVTAIRQVVLGGTSDGGTGPGLLPIFKFGAAEYPLPEIDFSSATPSVSLSDWIYVDPGTSEALTIEQIYRLVFGLKVDNTL